MAKSQNIRDQQAEHRQLNAASIKIKKAEYRRLNAASIKEKCAEYYRLNNTQKAEYYRLNASTIKIKNNEHRKLMSANTKAKYKTYSATRYKLNAANIKEKCKLNAASIKEKYHIQRHLRQDAADKLREKGPAARKTLSRSVIKKKVGESFQFGKNFIRVKDCKGDWTRVVGPCWHRVYIAINDAKRIRKESTVPFYVDKLNENAAGALKKCRPRRTRTKRNRTSVLLS